MSLPLILTLNIDTESFHFFDELRQLYFPPERNFLAAHVTLFHHLPGAKIEEIKADLQKVADEISIFPLEFTQWRFLGKGSAMTIQSAELLRLRAKLANLWQDDLTAQDKQKFQPHITVQNKVAPDTARELYKQLFAEWEVKNGAGEGLTLWHYVGPVWRFEQEFLFRNEP
jgi:2'-5' RNA ligase